MRYRWGMSAVLLGMMPGSVRAQVPSLNALVGTWVGGARGYFEESRVQAVTDSVLQAAPDTLRIWPDTTFSTKDLASMSGYVPGELGEYDFNLHAGYTANRNRFQLHGDTLVWAFPWPDSTGLGTRTLRFLLQLDQDRLAGTDLNDSRQQTSVYRRLDRTPPR